MRAGKAVPVMIITGLPNSSQEKVDRQRRRSLFDALFLAGKAQSQQEVKIATCLTRIRAGNNSGVVLGDTAVKQMMDCHIKHIRAVIVAMKGSKTSVRGLSQSSFLAAAVLYHEIHAEKCLEFLEGGRKGEMLTNDHPAMRLRKFLLWETTTTAMPRGGANQAFIFRHAAYAMQAHLDGKTITGLCETADFSPELIND